MYGLPYEYYKNYKIRRYGFHGTVIPTFPRELQSFWAENMKI